jgi:23S rRNA (cytosine1962-C5)-methyltransferase
MLDQGQLLSYLAGNISRFTSSDEVTTCRLLHGRGHTVEGFEHVNIDWYSPQILITLYRSPDECESFSEQCLAALVSWFTSGDCSLAIEAVLIQRRYLKGAPIELSYGNVAEKAFACEQGMKFKLNFADNQNIGFFLDMGKGREWVRANAENKRVLNLFAYTCSLGVAALAGGAIEVVNVDMSKSALALGQVNDQLNKSLYKEGAKARFLPFDIFRSWKKIERQGPYDLVILDPPSRQPGSFVAEKDYVRLVRRLERLVQPGGAVLACLNAPHLDSNFTYGLFAEEAPDFELIERLQAREDFPEADQQRSLKLLHYKRRAVP